MRLNEVIGQTAAVRRLLQLVKEERVPHALLFTGKNGYGTLALALAFAERLLCQEPGEDGEACGRCKGCLMAGQYAHPDLHFSFPFSNRQAKRGNPSATNSLTTGAPN